jgi:carbon-monoxide dehydrogenase medium subunit
VLVALNARFVVASSKGERTLAAGEFFRGMMSTALASNEILTAVEVPAKTAGQGMAYIKFSHPASRYAVLGVAAVLTVTNGVCQSARVAIGGLLPVAARAPEVEKALEGSRLAADEIARAAALVQARLGGDLLGDLFASVDYRKAMAPVFVKRAIAAAAERAS